MVMFFQAEKLVLHKKGLKIVLINKYFTLHTKLQSTVPMPVECLLELLTFCQKVRRK